MLIYYLFKNNIWQMCGICGWVDPAGIDVPALVHMNNQAAHRGPDGEGYWLWRGAADPGRFHSRSSAPRQAGYIAGLGHRRLAILDLSDQGLQPMSLCDNQLWTVFNGEIYNYVELRRELTTLGFQFHTGTDTEVLLAAYSAWGTNCFARFNGMWGLGIIDLQRRKLVLSRDRLGIKPLYYWNQSQQFAFASEIKQLLSLPCIQATANLDAIVEYIDTGYESTRQTFFRDVQAFPPGCWGEVDLDWPRALTVQPYWSLASISPVSSVSDNDARDKTRQLFADAVRLRMRSDVPVGVCLSGGLDSSAIFGQMQLFPRNGNGTTHAFYASFEEERFDERPYVQRVVERFGGDVHFTFPKADTFLEDMDRFILIHDEPPGSLSQYAAWDVMRLARTNEVPVLLNGQGGDELFTGYWPAYYLYLRQCLKQAPWRVGQHIVGALLPGGNPEFIWQLLPHIRQFRHRQARSNRSLLHPHLSDYGLTRDNWALASQHLSPAEYRIHELTSIHLPRLLKWDDRNSMAFSIEGRYPFLDYRLVEWVCSLPPAVNLHRGWNKMLVRQALAHVLPSEIRWRRSKLGFVTPQSVWVHTALKSALARWLSAPSQKLQRIVDLTRLEELGARLLRSSDLHQMDEDQFVLMRLFLLDRWLAVFGVTL